MSKMRCFVLGLILVVSGLVSPVVASLFDSGNCDCQHKCIQDKLENSTFIARVTVKDAIASEYEGAHAYRVSVTKLFPNSLENVERSTLLTDVNCPAKLDLHRTFLLAGSEVKYTPCSEPILWINSCDVVVPWKAVTNKQHRLLRNVNDIDDCQEQPCQNGGNCTDGVNIYTCSCAAGFEGDKCENDIDECLPNPCQNDGSCTDGVNSYTCSCVEGFSGDSCQYVLSVDCDFDQWMCGWTQDKNNDTFDWTRITGPTPSDETGPSRDHTTGNGFYMYADARGRTPGDNAILISPLLQLSNSSKTCVEFWFHMYGGDHVGEWKMKIYDISMKKEFSQSMKGNQGDKWHRIRTYIYKASYPGPIRISFEAVMSNDTRSDIAIDDIQLRPDSCSTS